MVYPSNSHLPQNLSQDGTLYQQVCARIDKAAQYAQRHQDDINLIAVSKFFPQEAIIHVIKQGQLLFGENYVQEAIKKFTPIREDYPDVKVHFIGTLQSNKADDAVRFFDAIHCVDRLSLVKAIARARDKYNTQPQLFIQVNTGDEQQKAGITTEQCGMLLQRCQEYGLTIDGFMVIPPVYEPCNLHFALLKKLIHKHHDILTNHYLSMGMSDDFEQAIGMGAHYIRIGRAIFGERPKK